LKVEVVHVEELERWRGSDTGISFEVSDFEILDLVTDVIPELRVCALAIKRARARGLAYPLGSADEIAALVEGDCETLAGHDVTAQDVHTYLPEDFFPIQHEGELASRIYLGLMRCNAEAALALRVRRDLVERLTQSDADM
jgi:hypothetical protein